MSDPWLRGLQDFCDKYAEAERLNELYTHSTFFVAAQRVRKDCTAAYEEVGCPIPVELITVVDYQFTTYGHNFTFDALADDGYLVRFWYHYYSYDGGTWEPPDFNEEITDWSYI